MEKSPSLFYLLGLLCGKGYILEKSLSLNFPHKNIIVEGIAHCPMCGYLATKTFGKDDKTLKCKNTNCDKSSGGIDPNIKKKYNQREGFSKSIKSRVIPFLKKKLKFKFIILSNNTVTILNIIELNPKILDFIKNFFNEKKSFDRFEIPDSLNNEKKELKVEFVNGLLDSCSYPSAGGWLNRDGKNGHGRMRSYFQIVRNWKLPVQIDNFLRHNFNIPTAKFDWGHPNIRDPGLQDYINQNESSFARECQVGFFPEYFQIFKHRISPKIELFDELLKHNLKVKFDQDDDWLKTKKTITPGKIKPSHPMENDYRIHKEVRGHFDAEWQINLVLGCKYLKKIQSKAKNKEVFRISGNLEIEKINEVKDNFKKIREKKYSEINLNPKKKKVSKIKNSSKIREQETYKPLVFWLKNYIKEKYKEDSEAFDTSAQTLNNFFSSNFESFAQYEDQIKNLEDLDIRPDIVGISKVSNKLFFIESKVVSIGIKEVGQIWAYSIIADPFESFLISTKDTSQSLLKVISQTPNFLKYKEKKNIKIGKLINNKDLEFIYE